MELAMSPRLRQNGMVAYQRLSLRTWKNLVWKRVKLTPTRRSSSWRASTACASASLGDTSEDWAGEGRGGTRGGNKVLSTERGYEE